MKLLYTLQHVAGVQLRQDFLSKIETKQLEAYTLATHLAEFYSKLTPNT